MLNIYRKELFNYFWSPIAYIVIPVFLFISGYFFSFSLYYLKVATMSNAFHNMAILLLLLVPVITMRLLSEEQKSGTLELLFSMPVSIGNMLLGKFLSAVTLLGIMLLGSLIFLVPLITFGDPDFGPIWTGYLGIFLIGTCYISAGLFVSSLTENQIVAALGTTAILILLWFIRYIGSFEALQFINLPFEFISISTHQGDFVRGLINFSSIVYLLTLTGLFYGLAWLRLHIRRYG